MEVDHPPKHHNDMHLDGVAVHDNTQHANTYIRSISAAASAFAAADIAVDATGPVTLVTVNAGIAAGDSGFILWNGFACNFRPGTITVDAIMDVWVEVGGIQRTAKFPVYCAVAIPTKLALTMPLLSRGGGDLSFWLTAKAAGAYTFVVRAQRQVSADPNANTILVSDKGASVVLNLTDVP